MSITFTDQEKLMLECAISQEEEIFIDMRKGIAQTKYVFYIEPNQTWNDWENVKRDIPIPDKYSGWWMMDFADNLQHQNLQHCLDDHDWVKCKRVETTTYEYVLNM